MMEFSMKLSFGVCMVLCMAKIAHGCSCMRSHPQQSLCADGRFGALVKVRNVEFVYIMERPKVPSNDSVNSTSTNDGDSEAEMERVEVVVKERDLYELLHTKFIVSYIRYRVKVYETYKGLKPEEVQGKKVYIYTAPYGSMCGLTLKEKEMYLLIGSIDENRRLRIGLCNYHVHWNSLETKQKRVIRRNMRDATETCESKCAVRYCDRNWMSCKKNKNVCLWTSQMERMNYKLSLNPANYACRRESGKQDARCTWTDGLSDAKRGRRRRRNHTSGLRSKGRKSHPAP